MFKAKIFIANNYEYFDEDVFVECKLISIPRIGEIFSLDRKLQTILVNKVTDKEKYSDWIYGKKERAYLSFCDAVSVKMIAYDSNSKYVKIVLGG